MFLEYLFLECSPILIPFDFIPEVRLDKDLNLSLWMLFMIVIVSIIVFSRLKEMKEDLVSQESESTKIFMFVVLLFFSGLHLFLHFGFLLNSSIAFCEGVNAFTPPPSPVQFPEEPVTPPHAPVPQPPVVIPHAQPLLSDDTRMSLLYHRYLVLNLGGRTDDLDRMVSILHAQVIVERYVEAALVDDGFPTYSILYQYREIRGLIHSPRGELLSPSTYNSYVTLIREHGTRESVPYRRILRAIQNNEILLERGSEHSRRMRALHVRFGGR